MWTPDASFLDYLVKLLKMATMATTTEQQKQITKSMDDFNQLPEADRYLAIVLLGQAGVTGDEIRAMAGLLLKNNLRRRDTLQLETLSFFKTEGMLLRALGDENSLVRKTTGTVLAMLACRLGSNLGRHWPELLPSLLHLMSMDGRPAEAASEALLKICEDCADELGADTTLPTASLIPALIAMLNYPNKPLVIANNALLSITALVRSGDAAIEPNMNALLEVLANLTIINNNAIMRCAICRCLNQLSNMHFALLEPKLPSIFDFMLQMMSVADDAETSSVALEACEFVLSLAEHDPMPPSLTTRLPDLLAILLKNMVFADDDPELEANQANYAPSVAAAGNVSKPRHHHARVDGGHQSPDQEDGEVQDDEEDGSGTGGDSEDDNEEDGYWNLRKCSAATLDILASTVDESVLLPAILPLIQSMLQSTNWKHCECGILALGAIAEGCMDSIQPHLPMIIPFLVNQIGNDSMPPLVKAISLWAMSRYAIWIEAEAEPSLAMACLHGILSSMAQTQNEKVQHAACSALSVFAEKAKGTLSQHLGSALQVIHQTLPIYGKRNKMVLFDVIGEMAKELGGEMVAYSPDVLISTLLTQWADEGVADDEFLLVSLLEALCSLALALPSAILPQGQVLFELAFQQLETTLTEATLTCNADVNYDLIIIALDLIGALVVASGETAPSKPGDFDVAGAFATRLTHLLPACFDSDMAEVRQSAFALIGDTAQHCPQALSDHFMEKALMPALVRNFDARSEEVSQNSANNAIWSLGELCLTKFKNISPHAMTLLQYILQFIGYADRTVGRGYLENSAVTLGRLMGLLEVSAVPIEFGQCLGRWSELIARVSDPVELASAWTPMINLILNHPAHRHWLTTVSIPPLLRAIAFYTRPPPALEAAFSQLLSTIVQEVVGASVWPLYRSTLTEVPASFDIRFATVLPLKSNNN